jgi:hypothetical protein
MDFYREEVQICQEKTRYKIRGRVTAEETMARGVESSAVDWANNDIEYEDDRRNSQHRKFHKAG